MSGPFRKQTIRDIDVHSGRRLLVRVDFNVPLKDGQVTDDSRIRAALPTIESLREGGAALVLCSHLGRPKEPDPATSLAPASTRLSKLIGAPVQQAPAVVGDEVSAMAEALEPGAVLVLENTRWEAGETKNDPELAGRLAALGDGFVGDAAVLQRHVEVDPHQEPAVRVDVDVADGLLAKAPRWARHAAAGAAVRTRWVRSASRFE